MSKQNAQKSDACCDKVQMTTVFTVLALGVISAMSTQAHAISQLSTSSQAASTQVTDTQVTDTKVTDTQAAVPTTSQNQDQPQDPSLIVVSSPVSLPPPANERLSMQEIERRLSLARADEGFYYDNQAFAEQNQVEVGYASSDVTPVSRIEDDTPPIGLDVALIMALPTLESAVLAYEDSLAVADGGATVTSDAAGIDPNAYLPSYNDQDAPDTAVVADPNQGEQIKQPSLVRRLYNRLFNDGVGSVPRLEVTIYESDATSDGKRAVDDNLQPYANIKAALSDVTQESALDFRSAAPRLRQAAQAAARAVGYYDTQFRLVNQGSGKVDVIIESLGEPVVVTSQLVEIRGEGADNTHFIAAQDAVLPKQGDIFHHGEYSQSKQNIENVRWQHGFFEGRWLNDYVDVILPDNSAEINLVYETGNQYHFDDVVFFTIDPQTGEFTTDPTKLPVDLELLHRMVSFTAGEPYDRSKVNALSGELMATRYFNSANVDTVFPDVTLANAQADGIDFEQVETVDTASTQEEVVTLMLDEEAGITAQIAPIDFSPSQELIEKLGMVTNKADILYKSPDNRVLSGEVAAPTSLLGKVSHAVSNLVRAILPDESKDDESLADEAARSELAGRKTPEEVYQDKKVPLYVFVLADNPRDAQVGLGYGSDTGVRATARFEHNLINRHGYQAGVQVYTSEVEKNANAYLSRPLTHPNNDKLIGNITYQEQEIDQGSGEYELSSRSLVTSLTRNIVRDSGWNRTYSLKYRLDELDTNAPPHTWVDLPVQFAENKPIQEALLVGYGMSKTIADNLANPTRGVRQYYAVEAGFDGVISDTNMIIARAGVGGVYSFGKNRYGYDRAHQLIAKLDAGYIWADDFDAVPYKLRFFAGGDQSLRGYDFESLSPISPSGYLTGGQSLAIGSLEYNYEVKEGLRAAVFADVGNAYDANFGGDTKIGAGVGVRWASPVGSVRVDVATGIGEEGTPIKLHFMIGMPF